MEKLIDIINQIKVNKGQEKLNTLSEDTDLRTDLGFDSLDLAELTVRIEKEFGVDIFENGLVSTVGEILGVINK